MQAQQSTNVSRAIQYDVLENVLHNAVRQGQGLLTGEGIHWGNCSFRRVPGQGFLISMGLNECWVRKDLEHKAEEIFAECRQRLGAPAIPAAA